MNKADLVDYMAAKAKLTKTAASSALEAFLEGVTHALGENDPVLLTGFCSLTVKQRAARIGYNPATGEKIEIKATKVIGFKAGKALKEAIKEKEAMVEA